jgi:putative ABC transport system permease protein
LKTLALSARLLSRDWKSGELTVLAVALVVAVTAMTAVAFLTDRVGQVVQLRAAESLAADLRLASNQALPQRYDDLAAKHGVRSSQIVSTPSVVFAGEANTLAAVRAAAPGYPLRGQLKTAGGLLEPSIITDELPAPGTAWASTRLLARLGANTGDVVEIGHARFTISRVLTFRPDQGFRFVDLAPTLLIRHDELESTGLVQPGSRVAYRKLFAAGADEIKSFKAELEAELADGERLRDISDANPQIRSAMDRSGRFLNLASLISVLLAAIAVAMAARKYAHRHRDRVALMKCMGSSRSFIMRVNLVQLLVLAIAGGVIGAALGFLAQAGLAWILRDLIAETLPMPGWAPLWLGLVTSLSILAGFALPDLLQMSQTPPLRVLRDDIEPPPLRYGTPWLAAIAAVMLLLLWMVRDAGLVTAIFVGTSITFVLLAAVGWLLVRSLQGFRSMAGVAWRYGLANVARRGRESIIQVVAFGLGLMVLLLLTTVRNDLMDTWRSSLPEDAPNRFLINIQPAEVPQMQSFLTETGIDVPEFVPLVRARLTQINGQDVKQISFEDPGGRDWARRDANLSWAEQPQSDNRIIEGQWWSPGEQVNEVSLEQDFAVELGLGLEDVLSLDIAGETINATVTSIRTVEWDSFQPNFFMVFSPGVLDAYPTTYISSLFVDEGSASEVIDLMRMFPSVTVIDLDAVLGQVRDVMDKAAMAVQSVFLFTLLAGLTVLWAAVQATRDERRYESAMLRTLGATRRRVLSGVATEFIAIGFLSGVLASTGASIAGWLIAERLFELEYQFSTTIWLAGPLAGMIFVGLSGVIATHRVVTHAPVSVLRET